MYIGYSSILSGFSYDKLTTKVKKYNDTVYLINLYTQLFSVITIKYQMYFNINSYISIVITDKNMVITGTFRILGLIFSFY